MTEAGTESPGYPDNPEPGKLRWFVRNRRNGLRSGRGVALMKLLLPALALAIIGLTILWPQLLPDQKKFRIGETSISGVDVDGLIMDNPRYVGVDADQRPYQISASTASQRSKEDRLVRLDAPSADILMANSGWVAMSAETGIYDKSTETVDLSGSVTLYYDEGYQFVSESARLSLRDGTAIGRRPITGHGEAGEIVAEGFRLMERGKRVLFTGKSKAVLRSAAK